MKRGTFVYDKDTARYDIRFGLDDYHGGLFCGQGMEVMVGNRWIRTRIEMDRDWYLVGIPTQVLDGLRVRIGKLYRIPAICLEEYLHLGYNGKDPVEGLSNEGS